MNKFGIPALGNAPIRIFVVLILALSAVPASAHEVRDSGVDVQHFRPGAGASDYLDILGGFTGNHASFDVGLYFNYANRPLLLQRTGSGEKVGILDSQGGFDFLVAFSLFDRLELGLALPLVGFQELGSGYPTGQGIVAPAEGFSLGDLRLTPKVKIIGVGKGLAVSIAAPMALPTGDDFAGYGAFSISPTLIADLVPASYFRLTLNIAGRFRAKQQFTDLALGRELLWGVGMKFSFFIEDQPFSVLGTFTGSFELPNQDSEDPPFDFLAGLEWRGIPNTSVSAAAGAGLTRAYGSPDWRVVLGVKYGSYSDCAYGEEDFDGFEDDDGCAEPDNDNDGLEDVVDLCPNERETINQFDDDDGCPDEAKTFASSFGGGIGGGAAYGFDSTTRDTDGDGVPDADDACPLEAEDSDGYEDSDGCPEFDNDQDGIADVDDLCKSVGETFNKFRDDDGCPDDAPTMVSVDEGNQQITITDRVYFASGKAVIKPRSYKLLQEIVAILDARPDIEGVRIEGHTDGAGPAPFNKRLSQKRADAVKRMVVELGIDGSRLVAQGFGEERPIASNRTRKGRTENRRVEFIITKMSKPVAPGDEGVEQ
ncbi:MAG: outer membrane protein OmpA-like peptidoglycan-associated protein [Myxococcota bacterium]|jgi:outer membrane protein OmpA-like peptidoglycan-associated protein